MAPWRLLTGALAVGAALGVARPAEPQSWADEAVAFARMLPIGTLDSMLRGPTLDEWLVGLVTPSPLEYEVDDCGEQSGNPEVDRARDVPACVSASARLTDGSQISVSVRVGTFQTGVTGAPAIWMVTVREGNDVRFLSSLAALADWLGHGRVPDSLDSVSLSLQTSG